MADDKTSKISSPLELKGLSKYISLSCHRTLERAVWTFAELGIADLMADCSEPITARELSQRGGQHWNAENLYRLLRVVADLDIVKECNANQTNPEKDTDPAGSISYQLTPDGFLLTSNDGSKAREMVRSDLHPNCEKVCQYWPSLIQFGSARGTGFEQAFGCGLFEYMQKEENREFARSFNHCMTGYSNETIVSMIPVLDFSRFERLVDIAGGLGTLLAAVLEKHRHLHGILFDLEHVINEAKSNDPNEFQRKQIEPDRYEFVAGDLFRAETIPVADAYTMKFIIHDWNDQKSIEILQAIRKANAGPTSKVLTVFIIEMVIRSNAKDEWQAHATDLEMLACLDARERTLFEFTDLLHRSGYQLKHLHKTNSRMSVIEAETTGNNDQQHL